MDKIQQLENRIIQLEKQFKDLNRTENIPLGIQQAFSARGFLSNDDFIVGQTTVGALGTSTFPIPGANKFSMAFVAYANFPDVNATGLDGYIEPATGGGYQLHLVGTTGQTINYVVFLNTRAKLFEIV